MTADTAGSRDRYCKLSVKWGSAVQITESPRNRGFLPAIALFFIAPLVAEFLLGNLPIKLLPALVVLAPMYGGGALLIRELVRRNGRGWPSIVLLGLAYGILEEAFTTQSLFNPDYLGMKMKLLEPAWIPTLGVGAAWTVFVLTIHTVWSISVPIALVEALTGEGAEKPWLGRIGWAAVCVLFAFGIGATTIMSYKHDHFLSSRWQLLSSALICIVLITTAFAIPRRTRQNPGATGGIIFSPWIAGLIALIAGSAMMLVPLGWGWGAVAARLAIDAGMAAFILIASRRNGWSPQHKVALAGGAALAYAWHAFVQHPIMGSIFAARVGNAIFAAGAIWLITAAWRRAAGPAFSETTAGAPAAGLREQW